MVGISAASPKLSSGSYSSMNGVVLRSDSLSSGYSLPPDEDEEDDDVEVVEVGLRILSKSVSGSHSFGRLLSHRTRCCGGNCRTDDDDDDDGWGPIPILRGLSLNMTEKESTIPQRDRRQNVN